MSALNCINIPDISIGNNYGGYISSFSFNIGFNSSTTIEATFVSESDLSRPNLSTESPINLSIAGISSSIYPISWSYEKNSSSKIMNVKFCDSSVKYLDKYNVGMSYREQTSTIIGNVIRYGAGAEQINISRYLNVLPVRLTYGDNGDIEDAELGKYSESKLLSEMKKHGIPISQRAESFLKGKVCYLNQMGNLRSVLSSIASEKGIIFYWDFFREMLDASEVGVSNASAVNLANSIKTNYQSKISSLSESNNIEDNFSYGVVATQFSKRSLKSKKTTWLSALDLSKIPWNCSVKWENSEGDQSEDSLIFSSEDIFSEDWKKLTLASSISQDFFNQYVMHYIASKATSKYYKFFFQNDFSGPSNTGQINVSNLILDKVINYFLGTDLYLILYHPPGIDAKTFIDQLNESKHFDRAEVLTTLAFTQKGDAGDSFLNNGNYWIIALKTKNQYGFETVVEKLYEMFYIYSNNFNRFYVGSNGIKFSESSKFRFFPSSVNWINEKDNVVKTPLSELWDLIKSYQDNDDNEKTAWFEFSQTFELNDRANQTVTEYNEEQEEDEDEDPSDGDDEGSEDNGDDCALFKFGEEEDSNQQEDPNAKGRLFYEKSQSRKKISCKESSLYYTIDSVGQTNYEDKTMGQLKNESITVYVVKRNENLDAALNKTLINQEYKRKIKVKMVSDSQDFDPKKGWVVPNQSNPYVFSNLIDHDSITSENESISLYLSHAEERVLSPSSPSFSVNISVEDLVSVSSNWIENGLQSYSVSINGQNGITSQISIGSRKKQRLSMETILRNAKYSYFSGSKQVKIANSSTHNFASKFNAKRDY